MLSALGTLLALGRPGGRKLVRRGRFGGLEELEVEELQRQRRRKRKCFSRKRDFETMKATREVG